MSQHPILEADRILMHVAECGKNRLILECLVLDERSANALGQRCSRCSLGLRSRQDDRVCGTLPDFRPARALAVRSGLAGRNDVGVTTPNVQNRTPRHGVVSQTIFPRWQDSMSALPCYLQSRIMRTKIGRHWPTFRCLSALVECLRPRISQAVSLALRHFVDRPSRENSRSFAQTNDRAEPHSTVTCES